MKINRESLLTDQFDYKLPEESIAKFPLLERDQSKLLVYKDGNIRHQTFTDIAMELEPDTLLVFNNTKVIPARIHFQKKTGAWIEILVVEKMAHDQNLKKNEWIWSCMIGNKKKWANDEILEISKLVEGQKVSLFARQENKAENLVRISWLPQDSGFYEVLAQLGEMPIPPYLNRDSTEGDKQNYQTVYAQIEGAIAAPTAGLHFTESVIEDIRQRGIETEELTLHVGLGTFKPMKANKVTDHEMHPEKVLVTKKMLLKLAKHKGRIVAVGTTSIRSLESLYWLGTELLTTGQLPKYLHSEDPYNWAEREFSVHQIAIGLLEYMETVKLETLSFSTQLYIMPGYKFKVVGGLITNFHQPKSTLLVLVSALIGDTWKDIYENALANNYRFLSYGDSSLLMP